MDDYWLTPKDVALRYCLRLSWVYTKAEEGVLPCYKMGKYLRFRQTELDAWVQAHRQTPPQSEGGDSK